MDNIINDMDLQQEERIMSFLQGKMTPEEESTYKEELLNNPAFKEKAISMARLAKGLSQVGNENDKVLKEAMLSSDEEAIKSIAKQATSGLKPESKSKMVPQKRKYITILSVAASLLFIIYFGFLYNDYSKTITLGDQYAMIYESSTVRGDVNLEVEKEIETLVNNVYDKKDLSKTLKRLAVLWEVSTQETFNDYTNFSADIGWALATGYLKDDNKEEAVAVLEKMAKIYDAETIIGKKVRELLKKTNDM